MQVRTVDDRAAPADDLQIPGLGKFYADPVLHFRFGEFIHDNSDISSVFLVPAGLDQFPQYDKSGLVEAENDNVVLFNDRLQSFGQVCDPPLNAVINETDQHSEKEQTDHRCQQHQHNKQRTPAVP